MTQTTKITLPFATMKGNAYLPTTGITFEIANGTSVKATLDTDGTFTVVLDSDNVVKLNVPSGNDKVVSLNDRIDTVEAKPAKMMGNPI